VPVERLFRHKVACVVNGNYAGLLRGVDVATEDVDITRNGKLDITTRPSGTGLRPPPP
jgi:hypothetical protein